MKLITVIGARPQFIKASIVSKSIDLVEDIDEIVIHTGQHFDKKMSDVFFEELEMPIPKYNLNINQMNHGEMTGKMLFEVEKILIKEEPDGVLVYGDTNSTLAASLSAVKLNIPIFHVEAGLRSFNRSMPEEINRILTDHISSLLFCPTKNAVTILKSEGIENGVLFSGDVMYDLFILNSKNIEKIIDPFILVTIHRPINTDSPSSLRAILKSLEKINKTKKVVFPAHPRTIKKIKDFGITTKLNLVEPFNYHEMINHLCEADMIITDSGGVQKESFFAKTKCLTIREETEWVELVDAGVNILCSPSENEILKSYEKLSKKECNFNLNLYGDGKAASKIVSSILEFHN